MAGRWFFRVAIRSAVLCVAVALAQGAGAMPTADSGNAGCTAARKVANLELTLRDPEGKPVDLRRFRGQVLLVNFWATWCKPCRSEIPLLIELFHEHRDAGFAVLGVSVDEDVARIAPFARALGMDYPLAVGRGQDAALETFGPVLGYPTSVLVARDGTICARHAGIASREALERDIRGLLRR